MRFALLAVVLSGCLSGSLDSNTRVAVIPKLSALPGDAEKRDGILNQSGERARPENRRSLTKRERKAETAVAIAAALIGDAFSADSNVTIGVATDIDENQLFEKPLQHKPAAAAAKPEAPPKAGELLPWIKLQKSKPADIDKVR